VRRRIPGRMIWDLDLRLRCPESDLAPLNKENEGKCKKGELGYL